MAQAGGDLGDIVGGGGGQNRASQRGIVLNPGDKSLELLREHP